MRTSVRVGEILRVLNPVRLVTVVAFSGLLLSLCPGTANVSFSQEPTFSRGVVAADHELASEAGARMLRQGGNVVDAAVATSFALSVVRPASCGIGGGGFMVIWDAKSGKSLALDYRERAPAGVNASMFGGENDKAAAEPLSVRGGLASGIPGTVAGLCYAAEKHGSLPLATLLQPAIEYCREGVPVDEHDIEVQASTLQKLRKHPGYETRFAELLRGYLNNGVPWKKGDRFHSPQLKTLEAIAQHGPQGFYQGEVASAIVRTLADERGKMTLDDLKGYTATERTALTAPFHGMTVVTMPPPSSGGIALLESLQSIEAWETTHQKSLKDLGQNSPEYVQIVTEVLKHSFADRAEYLGDTDFVRVPVDKLLSADYAKAIAGKVQSNKTLKPEEYGRFFSKDDGGTSHFSVMDQDGNCVACTETINLTFGSFVVVPDYGIVLNNQMDDFAADPGKPNAFGLIQSAANVIEPGKRPLSSMTPTIVVKDGRAMISAGASGGPRIITATLQNILNQLVFGMNPQQAVSAPRFHHQWSPNVLLLEPKLKATVGPALSGFGHHVESASSLAATQGTARTDKGLQGGSDPRKHGKPAGW
ncbi:MAG: gamma-glutamyltransferase [Planctomycetaceae bacterium]|nr:gamma-glutamyltransferase [Planctomycetaceae bacterium]